MVRVDVAKSQSGIWGLFPFIWKAKHKTYFHTFLWLTHDHRPKDIVIYIIGRRRAILQLNLYNVESTCMIWKVEFSCGICGNFSGSFIFTWTLARSLNRDLHQNSTLEKIQKVLSQHLDHVTGSDQGSQSCFKSEVQNRKVTDRGHWSFCATFCTHGWC